VSEFTIDWLAWHGRRDAPPPSTRKDLTAAIKSPANKLAKGCDGGAMTTSKSFKCWVLADDSGTFATNSVAFNRSTV
jgi:hypothetical protein